MNKTDFIELYKKIKSYTIVKDSITTTLWNTFGKAFGFFIPFFIAAWFGVTRQTDAFFFAYGIIIFLSTIFSPVVESIIVPYIAEARSQSKNVGHFIGKVFGLSGIGIVIVSAILLVCIKPILKIITRFNPQAMDMVFRLIIEIIPLLLFLVWSSTLSGAINAYKKFTLPAMAPAFRAIINITIIFALKDKLGVHAVALGYIGGEFIRMIILFSYIYTKKIFSFKISFRIDPKIREFFKTSTFQIFAMAAVGTNPFIDKIMATWLGPGSVTLLEYADRLIYVPMTFFYSGFVVVILSYLSERFYNNLDRKLLNKDILMAVRITGICSFIVMVILLSIHSPLTKLAFGRGEFPVTKINIIKILFLILLIGLVPRVMNLIFIRGLIILKKTKTLFKAFVFKSLIKIALNLVFIYFLGLKGIVLSTSITTIILFFFLRNTFIDKKRIKE